MVPPMPPVRELNTSFWDIFTLNCWSHFMNLLSAILLTNAVIFYTSHFL